MHGENIRAVDLNLLKVFDAIATEKSVTKAALAVGLSQPAVSHALNRLRAIFDDELFIRTVDGMQPTSKCLEVHKPIARALVEIDGALQKDEAIDPSKLDTIFRVGVNDLFSILFVPMLASKVSAIAPGVSLRFLETKSIGEASGESYSSLDSGATDLSIFYDFDTPPRFDKELLGTTDVVCVARKDNPALKNGMDMDTYLKMGHVMITPTGAEYGRIDHALGEIGLQRDIKVRVPHFSAALSTAANSDLIASAPRILAPHAEFAFGLSVYDLPFELPNRNLCQVWSRTLTGDRAHKWLRSVVSETFKELAAEKK